MLVERHNRGMRLPAIFTLVLFVSLDIIIVSLLNMSPQVCRLCESKERTDDIMHHHYHLDGVSPVPTHGAAEGLLPRVDHDVVQQGLACGELLVAD